MEELKIYKFSQNEWDDDQLMIQALERSADGWHLVAIIEDGKRAIFRKDQRLLDQLADCRRQTAREILDRFVTNHGDQDEIRRAYGIPAPYQVCPACHTHLDHRGRCRCA